MKQATILFSESLALIIEANAIENTIYLNKWESNPNLRTLLVDLRDYRPALETRHKNFMAYHFEYI